ncbi:MAG: methylmalonyl-CoA epimerase [Gemmatimonadaceae bacterium]
MQDSTPIGARISHVGIALASIADAVPLLRDILGMEPVEVGDSDGARIAAFQAGDALVELLEPEREDSPVGKFLARRGPGIHHICFAVDDIDATLERCRRAGVELVDETPRLGAEGKRIAFLHPRSTSGILIELSEP